MDTVARASVAVCGICFAIGCIAMVYDITSDIWRKHRGSW